MANPLFNALYGGSTPSSTEGVQIPFQPGYAPKNASYGQQMNMQDAMTQLRSNPAQMIRNAGYNVPDDVVNNPQATVMHLLQSGQIRNPMMQRIQPMLNMLIGRK